MSSSDSLTIAIIGMVARFPGANNVDEFWQNLKDGVESIRSFSDEELKQMGVSSEMLEKPNFVKAGALLEGIDLFDASFFDFSPIEARITDPQHRLFLECASDALENAGYDPEQYDGSIGVFGGAGMNTYLLYNLAPNLARLDTVSGLQLVVGNDKDYLATRVSYKLNLTGPSMNVQTACSTSLVAVSLACQGLLDYQCNMALAGGISVGSPHHTGYMHREGDITSPDGHCRAFDSKAQGTVFGNGVGIVVLKRLEDALADGDYIHAVIKGSAVNNDGSLKIGYTAPSVDGQMAVIAEALGMAGIEPETVNYVEAHGTGTPLGDPIEIAALKKAFGPRVKAKNFCAVGSVKTNIGHLDTAAGVAGLIKTVLSLKHRVLLPSLHFEQNNPQIDFAGSPFYINTKLTEWTAGSTPRRAGVSSFGIGGTNAHVIVEEAPEVAASGTSRPEQLLLLSAKSPAALDKATERLAAALRQQPDICLADVAFTLALGRKAFAYRRSVVCGEVSDAISSLASLDPKRVGTGAASAARPIVFMFPGQGAQYVNMAQDLYENEPLFRQHVDECSKLLERLLGIDLRNAIYPGARTLEASEELDQTSLTQPALFVIEYALAKLCMQWGIRPKAMIGHSIGEYVAACLAGVFTLEDGLSLVALRGRLMQQLPSGAMLAVGLSPEQVTPLLNEKLSLAAVNGPTLCTVSGELDAIGALAEALSEQGVDHRRLHTSHAFHSMMVEPIVAEFTRLAGEVRLNAPQIPYVSNLTGTWITAVEATDPRYWARHLRETVRFGDGVRELLQTPHNILLEVGPGRSLTTLVKSAVLGQTKPITLSTLRHAREEGSDFESLLKAMGQLWREGVEISWREFYGDQRRHRVPLPTYPFERQRFWIDPPVRANGDAARQKHALPVDPLEEPEPAIGAHARPALSAAYVAPRDRFEEQIARIWGSFLGLQQIGIHDNFFELGGHSLLATQLIARLRDAFQLDLPMSVLFNAPTVEEMAIEVGRLKSTQADYAALPFPTIVSDREHLHEPFPMTDVQQAYWIGRSASLELGNVATHIYSEAEFEDLDLEGLNHAWQRMIRRHDMLRAIVLSTGEQVILKDVPDYRIEMEDVSRESEAAIKRTLQAARERMSHQVLPTDKWPLFEIRATKISEHRMRLHVSYDLLIGDAWSWRLLAQELVRMYREPLVVLPELEVSFRDYVLGERAFRETETYRRAEKYWRDRLADLPGPPDLPLAKEPGQIEKPRFVRRVWEIKRERWDLLKERGTRAGLTPSGLLVAAYAEVLSRWSRRQHFTINLTLFNRLPLHPQINAVVGDFTSLTLLEVDNRGSESFLQRARKLQQRLWEDLDHRYVSAVTVMREMARLQGTGRTSMPIVFTSELNFTSRNEEREVKERKSSSNARPYSISQTPQVWIDHQAAEVYGALIFNWDVVEELFPVGLMEEMFAAYCELVERLVDDEATWHESRLELEGTAQVEARLRRHPAIGAVPEGLLHSRFWERVREQPEAVAVVSPHQQLSYGQLYECAHAVARGVREAGVGVGQLVAVQMQKGWEQVVAVLGILEAGGAYLPLSAELPQERAWQLLADAKVKLVLTQSWLAEQLSWPAGMKLLLVDEASGLVLESMGEKDLSEPLEPLQQPEDLAYVIYTSGSTGMPKGVMITHAAALNTCVDMNERFAVQSGDRVLALSSLSFDLSVYDLFGMLGAGATIVMPRAYSRPDPQHWLELVKEREVTIWNSVPQLLQLLVETGSSGWGESLRLVLLSGDWIPLSLPPELKVQTPRARVVSLGGATEASIWSNLYEIGGVEREWKSIPYGHALKNQQLYVLNERLEECPTWVVGQLYIGGVGLALGYWADEEKTKSRFIEHPATGERLYRTGDLGRYLADGEIEFLGREDNQVKVQGHRIELGEIETLLTQHEAVEAAVVTAVGELRGNKRLVAYIVANEDQLPDLRGYLKERLPEYMVPGSFVRLDALPLTANGKVNRNALPAPEQNTSDQTLARVQSPVEEMLTTMWADVVGASRVGIHDNFFELGGDSLLATRILSRVRSAFKVDLQLGAMFENATVADFARIVDAALRSGKALPPPAITVIPRDTRLPLSFAQKRLWFMHQLAPENASRTNLSIALRLSGELNSITLERAVNEIVRRHEVLRTNFTTVEGEPVSVIAAMRKLEIPFIDLSDIPGAKRDAEARRLAKIEETHCFDFEREPLVRVSVLKIDDQEYVVVVTMHHIISDGWSLGLMMNELARLYEAFSQNKPSPLPELPIQYVDFAAWQTEWMQDEVLVEQMSYWKQQLSGDLPRLTLPADRGRPPIPNYKAGVHAFRLSQELSEKLASLSRREGATTFMTLLAAYSILLGRYSSTDDIVVGTDIAGRNRAEIEGLIGFFVNQLVLRSDLSGNPTFRDLLSRVREMTLAAYAHQDLPFEKLVEVVNPERSLDFDSPLFQVRLLLLNPPQNPPQQSESNSSGIEFRTIGAGSGLSRYDLTMGIMDDPQRLTVNFEYDTDLFDPPTIERMAGHFETLLGSIVANPSQPISDLQILTESETLQLLGQWDERESDLVWQRECLQQLFEAQVEQNPEAPAIICEATQLSYREVNERANQLAHHLKGLGVTAEVRVGLCLKRSPETIVGLLGIMKSGGAYVPLDPSMPLERLSYVIGDAQMGVIVTDEELSDVLPATWAQLVMLDADSDFIAQQSKSNLQDGSLPESMAYLIYTSGSTGQPKGVMAGHWEACQSLRAQNEILKIGPGDRLFQFAPINFDASLSEVFLTLGFGATLVTTAAQPSQLLGTGLLDVVREQGVTVLGMPPSALGTLAVADLPDLRMVVVAGEACSAEIVDRWSQGRKFFNAYGPTETLMISTIAACNDPRRSTVIGTALDSAETYVVDEKLRLVPIGVTGELVLGGVALARGYLGKPEMTAEKFVPNSFSRQPGTRLYRTGDLARYLADGNLEFLGRLDDQVKIRGFRVELGEIETALSAHPEIQQTKVVVHEEAAGRKRLVAYVVPHQWNARADTVASDGNGKDVFSPSRLREFVKGRLPEYMVPSAWMMLERMPLTFNGKVDLRALPSPDNLRPELEEAFVAPRTATEAIVADIWMEVLQLEKVGVTDDFFELGGHSLLATQVISRTREVFHVEVPLRLLFETPTVAGFAKGVGSALENAGQAPTPAIVPVGQRDNLPLSFAQHRLWFLHQLNPGSDQYNFPAAVRLTGDLDVVALKKALSEIVRRHEALRTIFPAVDGQPVQLILDPQPLHPSIVDLSEFPRTDRETLARHLAHAEAHRPFALATGPLLRVTLLQLGEEEHIILFCAHHVIIDGWSLDVMIGEFATLYDGFTQGRPSPLPELTVQYKDFAVWQREWLRDAVLDEQLSYWKDRLSDVPVMELPTEKPRELVQGNRGGKQFAFFPEELAERIKKLAQHESVTLYVVLLAAFQILLSRYTEKPDVIVGSPSAGRNQFETEKLIGFFLNTLVMRTDLSGNPSFTEVLKRVREVVLGAQSHQDIPFEKLVEVLQPERSVSHVPLIQVWFVLMNAPPQEVKLPGLRINLLPADADTVKLDLGLTISDESRGYTVVFEYNAELFSDATIAEMLQHFETLLWEVTAQPEHRIMNIPLSKAAVGAGAVSRTVNEGEGEPDFSFS
jgi:amino acid adenylation domain-containing protein